MFDAKNVQKRHKHSICPQRAFNLVRETNQIHETSRKEDNMEEHLASFKLRSTKLVNLILYGAEGLGNRVNIVVTMSAFLRWVNAGLQIMGKGNYHGH